MCGKGRRRNSFSRGSGMASLQIRCEQGPDGEQEPQMRRRESGEKSSLWKRGGGGERDRTQGRQKPGPHPGSPAQPSVLLVPQASAFKELRERDHTIVLDNAIYSLQLRTQDFVCNCANLTYLNLSSLLSFQVLGGNKMLSCSP